MAVSARDPQAPLPERPEGRGRHARGRAPRPRRDGIARWVKETAIIVVIALALSALVRAFLVQAFYVPSPSMEDTLQVNDRIVASKITTAVGGVERGEVVVFVDPGGWLPAPEPVTGAAGVLRTALTFVGLLPSDTGQDLVKRVVAVAGDRISCCDANGRIVLNGVSLVENYIKGPTNQKTFDVVVPAGGVFVMGDNRGDSADSRYHVNETSKGAVPLDDVVGRAALVVWPLARWATLPVPEVFADPRITQGARLQ